MSISDRLDEIEARIIRAKDGRHTDRYMVLDVDAPAMLAALRAVLDACSTYEKTQAIYRIEMGQREIIRVVRAEIDAVLGEGS